MTVVVATTRISEAISSYLKYALHNKNSTKRVLPEYIRLNTDKKNTSVFSTRATIKLLLPSYIKEINVIRIFGC